MERERLISYVHDIVNKSISAQGYLKVLGKSELSEDQKSLLTNANQALLESLELIKSLRKEIPEE